MDFDKGLPSALLSAGLLALAGCAAVGPDYQAPEPDVPDAWHADLSDGLQDGTANLHSWWTTLQDPLLEDLIERAGAGSKSLEIAFHRILQARSVRGVATGELYPDLDASATWQRFRTSEGVLGTTFPPLSRTDDLWSTGVGMSWELDVFGRIRRSIESSDADLQASVENYRDALVLLYSEVAISYVEARTLQARISYIEANVGAQSDTLQLTIDRVAAEITPELDVRQAELNLARTEAVLPELWEALARAVHRLGVLLGEHPSALWSELSVSQPIPVPVETVALDIPVEAVRQRPDLRRAERNLAAQTAEIGVATANLYPRFSLVGSFAYRAENDPFDPANRAWNLGPVMSWNLFDGGRVRNFINLQDARTAEALAVYEQSVLTALEEVENSLVAYDQQSRRREMLSRSVTAAEESVKLVKSLYVNGLTNFQNVLDMERSLTLQQDELAANEGLIIVNLIRLYKALGGGWDGNAVVDAELSDQEQNGEPIL